MNCPNCGAAIEKKNVKYCEKCGFLLRSRRAPREKTEMQKKGTAPAAEDAAKNVRKAASGTGSTSGKSRTSAASGGMKTYVLKCKSCGGPLNMTEGSTILICPYCGSREVIEESDAVKIEKIRSDAYRDVELGRQKLQIDENRARAGRRAGRGIFIFTIILLCISLFGLMMAIGNHAPGSLVFAIIQIALLVLVLVCLSGKDRFRIQSLPILLVCASAFLIIPYLALFSNRDRSSGLLREDIPEWNELILSDHLPDPGAKLSRVYSNSSERLSFEIGSFTQSRFSDYVKECQAAGYTYEEMEASDTAFEAYDEEGYHIDLMYFSSSRELSVYLDAPIQMSSFLWPSHGLPKLLPAPESKTGKIGNDSAEYFTAYVGETDKQAFSAYAGACIDAGFDVDYYMSDTYFSGQNAEGIRLFIEYVGFETMEIRISNYQ